LLNALCHRARERGLSAFYIALKRLPPEAAAGLSGLRGLDLVCVDDFDRVAGDADWEQALFRCFNEVRAAQGRLLVSSREPLSALELALPDLASRLGWGVRQAMNAPGDDDKLAILAHRASAMRIEVPPDVQRYLLRYGRRDLSSLLAALERLREAAFADKRRITVPLAREVLDGLYEKRRD
jgi:DnaA family protein